MTPVIGFLPPCCEEEEDMERRKNYTYQKKERMETGGTSLGRAMTGSVCPRGRGLEAALVT